MNCTEARDAMLIAELDELAAEDVDAGRRISPQCASVARLADEYRDHTARVSSARSSRSTRAAHAAHAFSRRRGSRVVADRGRGDHRDRRFASAPRARHETVPARAARRAPRLRRRRARSADHGAQDGGSRTSLSIWLIPGGGQ